MWTNMPWMQKPPKKQETELYNISKGYTWLCHECKKEIKTLKKKNQNWEGEVEHPSEKNAEPIESYIENIKDSAKPPEAKKRKLNESEDKRNKNRDKLTVENSIENEKKKSEKPDQVVKDKEMNVLDLKVMKISKESLTSLEDTQWVDDQMINISFALKQNEIDKITNKIIFVSPSIT